MAQKNNYTLGRGELHFAPYIKGTQKTRGLMYFGNTPSFSASIESENLEHFNSDHGVKEKDDSVILQTNRTASFTTDNISADNLALFFFGEVLNEARTSDTVTDESITNVELNRSYVLGVTASNPVGVKALDEQSAGVNIVVTGTGGTTTYVEGVDYTIDMERARLEILADSTIVAGSEILVSYKTKTSTFARIISGSQAIEGELRFYSDNPKGENRDWTMPYVTISPNGDVELKGDDWQTLPFNVEILKKAGAEAIYIDGLPLVA